MSSNSNSGGGPDCALIFWLGRISSAISYSPEPYERSGGRYSGSDEDSGALAAEVDEGCREDDALGGVYGYRLRESVSNGSEVGNEDAGGGGGVSSQAVGACRSTMDACIFIVDERCRRQAAHGLGRT